MKNLTERLLILAHGAEQTEKQAISSDLLPPEIKGEAPRVSAGTDENGELMFTCLKEARQIFEREYIRFHLARFSGNVSRTAGFIGMERSALHRKLKLLGLTVLSRVQVDELLDKKTEATRIEVLQFANIAGPLVCLQLRQGISVYRVSQERLKR